MNKKRRVAASVLLIAFAFGLNITGVSPILGTLNEKYSQYGTSTVQLLQTIPYLLIMAGSYVIGWLTMRFSKKKIALAGLLVIGICGVIPFFTDSFVVLFAARVLIGFGFGIVSPLNTAIIAEVFPPEERASYMGLHVVGMGIGAMVGNVAGGVLAGFGYQVFYLIYAIALLAFAGVSVLLIDTPPTPVEKAGNMRLNAQVYVISLGSFIHTLFINAYSTNIGIYILEAVTDNPSVPGIATGINAAAAMVVGILFGRISHVLGRMTIPASIFAAAVGYGSLMLAPGMAGVMISSVCCGVSLSCFMAGSSYMISVSVEPEAVAKASGVFSIIGGIGGLIAPVVMTNLAVFTRGSEGAADQFTVAFWGMVLFGVVALALILALKGREEKAS